MTAVRLAAGWVLPMTGPPIPNGAVLVGEHGRILALGPDSNVPEPAGVPSHRSPGVLSPGFVNVHTHLELTGLEGLVIDPGFPDWIRTLRHRKAERDPAAVREAARAGLLQAFATGVTTVADTGDSAATVDALLSLGGSGVYFHEVFGPHPDQVGSSVEGLDTAMQNLSSRLPAGTRVRLGVSPHAPYSVSGPLYRAVADLASHGDWPLALHLAESQAETDLVTAGEGPFAEAWTRRGIPPLADPAHHGTVESLRSPVSWVGQTGALGPRTLCIHAIRVDGEDLAILAASGSAVAHCPRSNLHHHGRTASLGALRTHGIPVGLGTDSGASVAPADLRLEARVARTEASLSAEATVRLITVEGAQAIGFPDEGTLAPGTWGDLTLVESSAPGSDPFEAVLAADARIAGTWLGGRPVYRLP